MDDDIDATQPTPTTPPTPTGAETLVPKRGLGKIVKGKVPQEMQDAARDELAYPPDETDEG